MPACELSCPVVKAQLKKLAEHPEIAKDLIQAAKSKIQRDGDSQTNENFRADIAVGGGPSRPVNVAVSGDRLKLVDTAVHGDRVQYADASMDPAKATMRHQVTMVRGVRVRGRDQLLGTDAIQHTSRSVGDSSSKIAGKAAEYPGSYKDMCTCSLSCVVRGLKNDTFCRSILRSAAFFAFGLKLSSELYAWYSPIRLS